jgi:hypothetical protein
MAADGFSQFSPKLRFFLAGVQAPLRYSAYTLRMFEKNVHLIDRPPAPRERGTLKKNLDLKSPVYGGFRGRFRDVRDFSDILLNYLFSNLQRLGRW